MDLAPRERSAVIQIVVMTKDPRSIFLKRDNCIVFQGTKTVFRRFDSKIHRRRDWISSIVFVNDHFGFFLLYLLILTTQKLTASSGACYSLSE